MKYVDLLQEMDLQFLPTTQHIDQAAIPAQAAPNKTGLYLALGLVGILLVLQ